MEALGFVGGFRVYLRSLVTLQFRALGLAVLGFGWMLVRLGFFGFRVTVEHLGFSFESTAQGHELQLRRG